MCQDCSKGPARLSRRDLLARLAALAFGPYIAGAEALLAATFRRRKIICKPAWRARPVQGRFHRHTIDRLTVHHSGAVFKDNRDAPQRFRNTQSYHQSQGWPDIAYHVLIDRHGNIYKGRPSWARGDTFTDYSPRGHLLVMCEGNFSEQQIPEAQVGALCDVLAWACREFSVRPRTIKGHRDYTATACPGDDLYRLLVNGKIKRAVKRRLQGGGVELRKLCGDAGKRRVRRIENGTD